MISGCSVIGLVGVETCEGAVCEVVEFVVTSVVPLPELVVSISEIVSSLEDSTVDVALLEAVSGFLII